MVNIHIQPPLHQSTIGFVCPFIPSILFHFSFNGAVVVVVVVLGEGGGELNSPILAFLFFPSEEVKPKKQHRKNKQRQKYKGPLTRKQRIRQQIRERMLQAKAAIIEV